MFERPIAFLANQLLTLLRNGSDLQLTREEFRYSKIGFSQFGEDHAIMRWLDEHYPDAPPYYVDAGCFHPIHCSNTLLLYKRGWRGVNIDLLSSKIDLFNRLRPEDENIVAALSDQEEQIEIVSDGSLVDHIARPSETGTAFRTQTLSSILSKTFLNGRRIGYLDIDCEGHDLQVLRGIDLKLYEPAIITIETAAFDTNSEQIISHLSSAGYELKEQLHYTSLFVAK